MNKILFYSNQGLAPLHLGIELEIISELLKDKNNKIVTVTCNSKINGCFFNPTKNILACALCESRTRHFQSTFKGLQRDSLVKISNKFNLPTQITSLTDIENLTYKGINIGRGIASSLISITRDFEIEKPHHYNKLIEIYKLSIEAYDTLIVKIETEQPDEVYFFNGRFAESYVLLEICKKKKITYYTMEVASIGKYQIFKNSLPHSIKKRDKLLKELWTTSKINEKEQKAIAFYERKRKGVFEEQYMHTKNQELFKLPEHWNNTKRNIVIFNSSEDEMKMIEEWRHDLFDFQNDVIVKICETFSENDDFHFYLRVHPNLGVVDNVQMREISQFNFPNLTIIYPDESIDSYALLENAEKVITFGSTIGIEATYHKVPSIVFGRAFYENTDATYMPKSYSELFDLITSDNLAPKPKENTYSYGYFVSTFGTPFENFQYKDKNHAFFKGKKVKRGYFSTFKYLILYLKYAPHWLRLTKVFTGKPLKIYHLTKLLHQIKY